MVNKKRALGYKPKALFRKFKIIEERLNIKQPKLRIFEQKEGEFHELALTEIELEKMK